MYWRRKWLIGFKSLLKTLHCCSVSSITNPQQSTDLAINPVQGFSHTNLLNHSLRAAVIYATRWGRNHSLPVSLFSALPFLTSLWVCFAWCFQPWQLGRKGCAGNKVPGHVNSWCLGGLDAPGWVCLSRRVPPGCAPAIFHFRSGTKNTHTGWVNPSAKWGKDSLAHLGTLGYSPM